MAAPNQPDWLPPFSVTVIVSPGANVVLFAAAERLTGPWWWQPLHVTVLEPWHVAQPLSL
jgi:hypothetical protein